MYLLVRSSCVVLFKAFTASLTLLAAPVSATAPFDVPIRPTADFGALAVSAEARRVADWVVLSSDNNGLPFIIVDKVNATLFLFSTAGGIRAAVPALVGADRGDDSVPGIGTRPLAAIRPAERTTPAGRFVARLGHDSSGADILWVDYDDAIALHRVSDRKPGPSAQSRAQRLHSTVAGDRRASLGCIGVSSGFYTGFVRPTFSAAGGIVYVLPETRTAAAEFHIDGGV